MIYSAYQACEDFMAPVRAMAGVAAAALRPPALWPGALPWLGDMVAAWETVARTGLTHARPSFGIDSVRAGDMDAAVTGEVVDRTPFATLLRFRTEVAAEQPRVLLVAPMSGHFATLFRGTIRAMLPELPSIPGRPVSEYGRSCHGDGGHEGGHRRRRALMLTILQRVV